MYHRLALSTADVEDLLAARGVIVSREAISPLGQSLWPTLCKLHSPGSTTAEQQVAQFGEPRVVITDKSRSYIKPVKTLAPNVDHRAYKGLHNAIEVSHRPTRKREKIFGKFKSHRQAQRFLAAHDQINLLFCPRRYQLNATSYRHARSDAFRLWAGYIAEMVA